jgi:hypothetical protein
MRTVSGPSPGLEREFVPASFGNRSDPDPIRVWILSPTEAEKREVNTSESTAVFDFGQDGSPKIGPDGKPLLKIDLGDSTRRQHALLKRFVSRVTGYFAPGGNPITDGDLLARHGETDIVGEVYREIMTAHSLTEAQSKKSDGSRASLSAAIRHSDGTVGNVCAPDPGKPGTAQAGPGLNSSTCQQKPDHASIGAQSHG